MLIWVASSEESLLFDRYCSVQFVLNHYSYLHCCCRIGFSDGRSETVYRFKARSSCWLAFAEVCMMIPRRLPWRINKKLGALLIHVKL